MTGESSPLDALIDSLSDRLTELRQRLDGDPQRAAELVPDVLEHLSVSLEELGVSSEELQEQADELEAAWARVELERRRYQELFDLAPDGYLVTDLEGRIMEANRVAGQLLGRPSGELLGKRMGAFLRGRDLGRTFRLIKRMAEHGGEVDMEVVLVRSRHDSVPVWLRISMSAKAPALADEAGEARQVRWAIRDMNDLAAARTRLEEANRFKQAVLLTMSHDLRSPLWAIDTHVEALSGSGQLSAENVHRRAVEMRRAVRQMQVLMSNLFDVDRLGVGAIEVARTPTDVLALVQRCVDESVVEAKVKTDLDRTVFEVDGGLTERIVRNLLANVEPYGPSGIEVTITSGAPGDVLIIVDDCGPGIPDAGKKQVFDLFYRLNTAAAGTGVGLYLVRQFAELHGGKAWIEDSPGGGASVRVLLRGAGAR